MDIKKIEEELSKEFKKIEEIEYLNSQKVIEAFWQEKVSTQHFVETTGYGYGDLGRDTLEKIYARIFKSEDALVRTQFISGTHAISTALFALLRPHDTLLTITSKPYDTLLSVIGLDNNPSSLKSYLINYEQIDLVNNDFDIIKIQERLKKGNIKVIHIQRSKGYSTRESLSITKVENVIKKIREIDNSVIIMVDNCYCEFVSNKEPIEIGADICIGSLIKNLGGGISPNGGYIVGRKDLILLCSERLNVAGEAKEVGPSLGANKQFYQGLYMAPSVVASSLKTSLLAAYILEKMGYIVSPKWNEERVDIVRSITFNDKDTLIKFIQGIQMGSAIDSNVLPIPYKMPGYNDDIIMASGSFTQGSSIELSCDGPIKEPFVAYLQGGLTYQYGKIGVLKAIENIKK
ncbi:MAG: aminotransferase class I/II-fold pyridoxal phosphate-dependent enzyme [Bacilli bacterium]